jgi:hypothetical protein
MRTISFGGLAIVAAACGVRKLGSSGEAVFVDESAESVSAFDGGCWQVQDSQLPGRPIGRDTARVAADHSLTCARRGEALAGACATDCVDHDALVDSEECG